MSSSDHSSDLVGRLLREKRARARAAGEDEESQQLLVCAPMVRYSKLAFRLLCRRWGCDLCYSPMILADAFAASARARDSELTTSPSDRPLVVQLAAGRAEDFLGAAALLRGHCDGVDLNCGCPQRWAWREGVGACLIHRPEFLRDLVRRAKRGGGAEGGGEGMAISVKIRVHEDGRETVELCRQGSEHPLEFATF